MSKHEPITIKSGKELPVADLKGKPYLQVAYRLVWFREEHPDWTIDTQIIDHKPGEYALVEASILDEKGRLISKDRKHVPSKSFQQYIEKATTGAIGRALALCGYGTQFEPEFDEGDANGDIQPENAADSAVERPKYSQEPKWVIDQPKIDYVKSLASQARIGMERVTEFYKSYKRETFKDLSKAEYEILCTKLKSAAMDSGAV